MSEQHFFKINGMKCGGCVAAIEKAIKELDGVEAVEVNLETSMASVTGNVSGDAVVAAVDGAGFSAALVAD